MGNPYVSSTYKTDGFAYYKASDLICALVEDRDATTENICYDFANVFSK